MKRFLDIFLSTLLLLATAPLLLAIALTIKLTMGSPVLFRQTRPGRHENPFVLLKFRTMRLKRSDHDSDEERLTALGRWLRRTSLDELPSLINVLRGEMSLVGPRPLLMRYLPHYEGSERIRHDVRPGLTGLAQIHGRNQLDWSTRLACDVWYVRHHSLALDTQILCQSIRAVILSEGVVEAPDTEKLDLDEKRA